jgi:hypothetical protein
MFYQVRQKRDHCSVQQQIRIIIISWCVMPDNEALIKTAIQDDKFQI